MRARKARPFRCAALYLTWRRSERDLSLVPDGVPAVADHLKMFLGIFTWTPRFGLSTNCVIATFPAMLMSW